MCFLQSPIKTIYLYFQTTRKEDQISREDEVQGKTGELSYLRGGGIHIHLENLPMHLSNIKNYGGIYHGGK